MKMQRGERAAAMDKAARLVREGSVQPALQQYRQLFEQDPSDWTVGNALGDLYVRVGSTDEAIALFMSLGEQVAELGHTARARALYRKVLRVQPGNTDAIARVAELENEHLGSSPFMQRIRGALRDARAAEPPPAPADVRVEAPSTDDFQLAGDESTATSASLAAVPLAEGPPIEAADASRHAGTFHRLQATVQRDVARGDFQSAFDAVEQFLRTHPSDVAALETLVELAVDGNLDQVATAQIRLANACLETGRASTARHIAVDLQSRYPADPRVTELIQRLFAMAGLALPTPMPSLPADDGVELFDDDGLVTGDARGRKAAAPGGRGHGGHSLDPHDEMRAHDALAAAARFGASGNLRTALATLEPLMETPALRQIVSVPLAQLYRRAGDCGRALTCLELAAAEPPVGDDQTHSLAYELALTLETMGHRHDALSLYRELLSEVGPAFRDVAARAEQLSAA